MAKQYRITIRGKQREEIDADLMARLVIWFGRELSEDAREAIVAQYKAKQAQIHPSDEDGKQSEPDNRRSGEGA